MTKNRFWRAVAGLASALFLLVSALPAQADDLPIGICQSTAQGPAKFATALWKGAEIAINEVNAKGGAGGRKLVPVPVDIGNNDPAQARLSLNKAIEINKIASLVCWGTNVMVQNGPLIDEADIAAFTLSQGVNVTKVSKQTQQLEAVTTLQCRVAASYVKEKFPEAKSLAVLYVNYEYGIELRDKCDAEFGKLGIKLVASEAHPNAPPDLRAQFTKLVESKPDAIYLASIGGGTVALGVRTARELGFNGVLLTHGAGDTPDIYGLKAAESNFYFVSHAVPPEAPEAVKTATDAYGGYTGAGYDYAWLIAKLAGDLAKDKTEITGKALITKLRAEKTIKTPINQYVFEEDGNTVRPLAIFSVSNGGRKLEKILSAKELQ